MMLRFARWNRWLSVQVSVFGRVRLHPLFFILTICAVGAGMWREVAVLYLLVLLHELGHATWAAHLGCTVQEVSLLPFGGVARLSYGNIGFSPKHEAGIAIAGPLVNLVLALFAWVMFALGVWGEDFFHTVVELNLWIVVFNLLPGLPLDGGRLYRAARAREAGYERATREAYGMAFVIAAVLLVLGAISFWAGRPHLGMILLGTFLFATAWAGRRDIRFDTVRFLDAKRRQGHRTPERVRAIAAPVSSSVRDVVKQFAPDRYHLIYVLDDDGAVRTILEEDEILEAVFAGRWTDTIASWIDRGP